MKIGKNVSLILASYRLPSLRKEFNTDKFFKALRE